MSPFCKLIDVDEFSTELRVSWQPVCTVVQATVVFKVRNGAYVTFLPIFPQSR
jgi:hypothetical protein